MRRYTWLVAALALAFLGCASKAAPFFPTVDSGPAPDVGGMDGGDGSDGVVGDGAVTDMAPVCPGTEAICMGTCVNLQHDPNNCGACGTACPSGTLCAMGACRMSCPMGLLSCPLPAGTPSDAGAGDGGDAGPPEICVDLMNSRFNCGACGHACAPAETCGYGRCYLDCGSRTLCDPSMFPAGGGDGGAADGSTGGPPDAGMDGGGRDGGLVAPYCADLTYDPDNCGACGHGCSAGHMCESSHCVLECVIPQMGCRADATHPDGYCANFTTDPTNCGSCGHTCPMGQTCTGGTCTCMAPQLACGALCVDPRTDPMNCGACGRVVGPLQYCAGGVVHDCAAPSTLCPGNLCTNLLTDAANCATCGHACPSGNTCVAGACICPPGSMVCGGACVNLATDNANCGACGVACPTGQFCLGTMCSTLITAYHTISHPAGVAWLDACAAPVHGTQLMGVDDCAGSTVDLPFGFRFYETVFNQVTPTADGYVLFGTATTAMNQCSYSTTTFPSVSGPRPAVFAYNRDLFQRATGVCTATFGAAPNRQFVVETNDAYNYADASTHLTFETIFNEGTNTMDMVYQNMAGPGTSGDQCTVALQNAAGTVATTFEHTTAGTLMNGTTVRFAPGAGP